MYVDEDERIRIGIDVRNWGNRHVRLELFSGGFSFSSGGVFS